MTTPRKVAHMHAGTQARMIDEYREACSLQLNIDTQQFNTDELEAKVSVKGYSRQYWSSGQQR